MFVITGGGSGIGRALALALAERGKKVLIIGRREALLQETAACFPGITCLQADISGNAGRDVVANFLEKETSISALINNAGMLEPIAALQDIPLTAWQQAMATNIEAPLFLTQKLFPKLNGGRVLNISSALAHMPAIGLGTYCVSKAALFMLTQCWRLESHNVAITSVMPGIVETQMQDLLCATTDIAPDHQQFFNNLREGNQRVSPETVAAFLCWLLLDVPVERYVDKEWDIYDQAHHAAWLKSPHCVPVWSE